MANWFFSQRILKMDGMAILKENHSLQAATYGPADIHLNAGE